MRIFYLPASACDLSSTQLRENMRRWHWVRYFQLLRIEKTVRQFPVTAALWKGDAMMHRKHAEDIERHQKELGEK